MKTIAEIATIAGITEDDALVLQTAATALLAAAARGEIDLNEMARREMASRGLDKNGKWVGFAKAAEIHGAR